MPWSRVLAAEQSGSDFKAAHGPGRSAGEGGFLHRSLIDQIAEHLAESLNCPVNVHETGNSFADVQFLVSKTAMHLEVPEELLMEYGVIPDTRTAPPPPSRRSRFRWWLSGRRESLGQRAYRLISGSDFPDGDDY
jgi:hypothetical protein